MADKVGMKEEARIHALDAAEKSSQRSRKLRNPKTRTKGSGVNQLKIKFTDTEGGVLLRAIKEP